jgi:hypothetical protein
MSINIIMPGDQFAKQGTIGWADWQRARLKMALKDVHCEAREIVQVIRDMCAGAKPAWQLMTRREGHGFRTFEEFVTSPEGLRYGDYQKFRAVAISESGIMNGREYDLLTAAPVRDGGRPEKNPSPRRTGLTGTSKTKRLRAINRAPALIRKLYVAGLIDVKLAELLGPDEHAAGYEERKSKAQQALQAIQALAKNGDDAKYRHAVNETVRRVFARPQPSASALEQLRRCWSRASATERKDFLRWLKTADAKGK